MFSYLSASIKESLMLIILLLTMSNIFLDITHYLIHLAINNVEFLVNVIFQTRKRWVKAIFKICKILFHAFKTCVMRICGSKGAFEKRISNLNFKKFKFLLVFLQDFLCAPAFQWSIASPNLPWEKRICLSLFSFFKTRNFCFNRTSNFKFQI